MPQRRTPASRLAPAGLDHHEVLRIAPNGLGPEDSYDIVIDAWTDERSDDIVGVKMWWLDRAKSNERSPFGPTVRSRIDVRYVKRSGGHWVVQIRANGKRFDIDVRRDTARPDALAAYGTIVSHGVEVAECRATESKVVPTTMLGIPTGLDKLKVSCIDANGVRQHGRLR